MKKLLTYLLSLCLLAGLIAASPFPAKASDQAAPKAKWTVLFYLCGTDLESNGCNATVNLGEIGKTKPNDSVNMVVQTGGTKIWHSNLAGLDVKADKIQRWHYGKDGYKLKDEQPIANMSSAKTLQDFLTWGAKTYPAEKYMLIMWDHGGGPSNGLISDQLHDDQLMSISSMAKAIKNSGVKLETFYTDCCMMGGIEEASLLKDYAKYSVGCEEIDPGFGFDFKGWLQYLYDHSDCDGKEIGKTICETAGKKYSTDNKEKQPYVSPFSKNYTFSCVDLSKTEKLEKAFDAFFEKVNALIEDNPAAFTDFAYRVSLTEYYGYSIKLTYDIVDYAQNAKASKAIDAKVCDDLIAAVKDMVISNVVGKDKSHSNGISFFNGVNTTSGDLSNYSHNCFSAPFLAYLDAVNGTWTAPDWVYQQTTVPELNDNDYKVTAKTTLTDDGELKLEVQSGKENLLTVDGVLAIRNADEEWTYLGEDFGVKGDFSKGEFSANFNGNWPIIGNDVLSVSSAEETNDYILYDIPVTIGDDTSIKCLRAALVFDKSLTDEQIREGDYSGTIKTYGIWEGYDDASGLPSRQAISLAGYEGQDLNIVNQIFDPTSKTITNNLLGNSYTIAGPDEVVNYGALPSGVYCYSFKLKDALGRVSYTDTYFFEYDADQKSINWDKESLNTNLKESIDQVYGPVYDIMVNK